MRALKRKVSRAAGGHCVGRDRLRFIDAGAATDAGTMPSDVAEPSDSAVPPTARQA